MPDSLQPDLQGLLEDVVRFLIQVGEAPISKPLRTKADDLKQRIENVNGFRSGSASAFVDEETYDEAGIAPAVPESPKAKDNGRLGKGGPSGASIVSPKTSMKRVSSRGSWHSDEQPIAELPASSFPKPTKKGYLEKKRPDSNKFPKIMNPQKYQRRYCVIHDGVFYYYDNDASKKQNGAFHLKDYEARPAYHLIKNIHKKEGSFEMVSPGKRSYQFGAKDFEEMKEWITAVDVWSDLDHPDVSSIARPTDVPLPEKSSVSSGSDAGSISISVGPEGTEEQTEYEDADNIPAMIAQAAKPISPLAAIKPVPPIPQDEEIYDEAETDQQVTYDEATGTKPKVDDDPGEIYDEAMIDEETYDEGAKAPITKPLPKRPGGSARNLPPPPIPQPEASPRPGGKRNLPPPPIPQEASRRPLPSPPKTVQANSEEYENMFYGLWDCETSIDHELAFSSGDIIHVVDREHDGTGWWTGLLDGKVGLVPKTFLTAAYAAC